jgi:genome maintenance exonuclease 1
MFNFCPPRTLPNLTSETQSDGKRFYTLPSGKKVPSVTTVVGSMKKAAIMEWRARVGEAEANRISKKASSRGTNAHTICEKYMLGRNLRQESFMPDAMEMFISIKPYVDKINNIHYMEQSLWSENLELAGRVDTIAEYEGKLSVIDFKTSSRVKNKDDIADYFAQTCAYALMSEELTRIPVDQLVIIMSVENDAPLVFVEKTEDHIETLVRIIAEYRRKNK